MGFYWRDRGNFNARQEWVKRALQDQSGGAIKRYVHDRVGFAKKVRLPPDPWQEEVLRSNASRILLNCSRQSGKSTITAVLGIHKALFDAGSLILMVSATQRQSGELFRKALNVYRQLGKPIRADLESVLQLQLANGSRIVALPGKEGSIRSYSGVDLLLLDEASRIADETYASVRPMLAVSQGRIVAMSTPFGTRGWWYNAWRGADGTYDDWQRWEVPAMQCPRISAQFLEEERRNLGYWWYEQEYMCRFLDSQSAAFRQEDIDAAVQEYETWGLE